jgi:hypothetical protein
MQDLGLAPIQISETERVKLYFDENCYDLMDAVGDSFGVFTVDIARGFSYIEQGEYTDALNRFRRRTHGRDQLQRAIELYLSLAGMNYEYVSLRGHSQGDWADVIVYGDYDLTGTIQALRDWFSGDIFVIAHEKLHAYAEIGNPENNYTQWELEDAIGNVMLSKDYTFEQASHDHFGYLFESEAVSA